MPPTSETQLIAQDSYQERLRTYAQQITVKITTSDNAGSGILIGKQGNTYLVLGINGRVANPILNSGYVYQVLQRESYNRDSWQL